MKITRRYYYTLSDAEIKEDDLLSLTDTAVEDIKLVSLIFSKYNEDWITYEDVTAEYWDEPVKPIPSTDKWKIRFKYIYDITKDRYKTLIKLYTNEKDNLMKKLENTNTVKFNDTPSDQGDFTGNGYTSTITTSTTQVDNTTIMNRLAEVYDLFKDLYGEWVEEFNDLFGEM